MDAVTPVSLLDAADAAREALLGGTWFRALPEEIADALLGAANPARFATGAAIHHEGDASDALYAVVSGSVKVSSLSADGRECVFRHLRAGDWFGEIGVLDHLGRTHDAVAVGDTRLLVVPPQRLAEILERHPQLYKFLSLLLCRVVRTAFTMLNDSTLLSLPARLAKRLVSFAEANPGAPGAPVLVRLTQDELAALCATTRQTVNKRLVDWQRRGWLSIHYGTIAIHDLDALRRASHAT